MVSENNHTTTNNSVSNQQFHDLHTLDIGRHVADRGSSFNNSLTFDPKSKSKKRRKKKKSGLRST